MLTEHYYLVCEYDDRAENGRTIPEGIPAGDTGVRAVWGCRNVGEGSIGSVTELSA